MLRERWLLGLSAPPEFRRSAYVLLLQGLGPCPKLHARTPDRKVPLLQHQLGETRSIRNPWQNDGLCSRDHTLLVLGGTFGRPWNPFTWDCTFRTSVSFCHGLQAAVVVILHNPNLSTKRNCKPTRDSAQGLVAYGLRIWGLGVERRRV